MFSIVLPTLPSFIASVGGNVGVVGWAVSVNSFGTFIFSPIMGLLADRIGFRWVFLGSLVLMFGGSVWYSLSPDIYQLLAARFVVGAAAANFAPAGAYLSYASQSTSRTKIMAWNSAATVLGFICGPAFSLLTSFKFVEFHIGFVHFDSNTAPGYISAVLSLIAMFCLIPFQEISKTRAQAVAAQQQDQSFRSLKSIAKISKMKVPLRGIVVLLFNCFVFTAAFTVFETTGALYTKYDFDWDNTKTSIMYLAISLVCLVALMSLQAIVMCAQEHVMMIVFMFVMTLGMGLFINWNAYVSFPVFLVAVTLVSIGYADSQALLLSIFAALLDSQEQGLMMGWLSSSSSVARMICPPAASYTYQYLGVNAPNIVFIATTGLILVSDVLTLTTLKHLKVSGDKKKDQKVFGGH
jgi:MFS family permease